MCFSSNQRHLLHVSMPLFTLQHILSVIFTLYFATGTPSPVFHPHPSVPPPPQRSTPASTHQVVMFVPRGVPISRQVFKRFICCQLFVPFDNNKFSPFPNGVCSFVKNYLKMKFSFRSVRSAEIENERWLNVCKVYLKTHNYYVLSHLQFYLGVYSP